MSGEPRDPDQAPAGSPLATIDLATRPGVDLVRGEWRYGDARIVETGRRAPGADGDPTGRVFYDMTSASGEDAIDGIKVDRAGNLFVSGPGGLWVLSPEGRHLGTLHTPMHVHNLVWGDDDGRALYLAARSELYRLRVRTGRPEAAQWAQSR